VGGVVLADQPVRIYADGRGDGADMPARVEVPAAGIELIVLDRPDQAFPDAGAPADVRHG
jgi:hypothetical protein